MAKDKNSRRILVVIAAIGLILTIAGIFGGVVLAWGSNDAKLETVQKTLDEDHLTHMGAVSTLKKDGCDPVHDIDKRCIVLETQWKTINASQEKLETGQEKILEALKK